MDTSRLGNNPIFRATLGIVVLVVSFSVAFGYIYRERIFLGPTSVLVYGTENCSFTTKLRRGLDEEGVPYVFVNVDGPYNFQEMQTRLGVHSGRFTAGTIRLPVVYQSGAARERPALADVVHAYSEALSGQSPR